MHKNFTGHHEVTAENNNARSSRFANSSAGAGCEESLMRSWTKIFCNKILRSIGEKSDAGPFVSGGCISGRSKNKYKHFTSVEGTVAAVITSTKFCSPADNKFRVDRSVHPLESSSL